MRLDRIRAEEDGKILSVPEIAAILNRKRRNTPLIFAEVKKLLETLQPGMARQANLEEYAGGWRLRFSLFDADGGRRRRSIVIKDTATMEWVRNYLVQARRERSAYKSDLWFRDLEERWKNARNDTRDLFNTRLVDAVDFQTQ